MSAIAGNYPQVTIGTLAHQDFAWARIEQSKGTFNFQIFDKYVTDALQHGLVDTATNTVQMAMTLAAGTPGWAVANQSSCAKSNGTVVCTAAPDNIQDWKDFLTALIQHYNGKTQPHLKYYELWNEFNISLWWTGTDAQMLGLAEAAYPIIHQDPYSVLLTPSVAGPVGMVSPGSQVTRMTAYLQAGGFKYADGGAFHGYIAAQGGVDPFPLPEQDSTTGCEPFLSCHGSIITIATQMRAVFDQNGLKDKPIFQTEGSWGDNTVTDPDTQVAWLARYNLLQAGLRTTLNLQMAAWFTWAEPSFGWGDIATVLLEPTAAGLAYNQVYNWVVGATMSQPCSGVANGTWTCMLTRPGGYVAQAVWNTQGSSSYAPGAGYTQYRDLVGNTTPIAAGALVAIGAKPILVEHTAAPQINNDGIVNNASYNLASSSVAAGSIAAIFGSNLTDGSSCLPPSCNPKFGSNGRLNTTMAGAQVTVGSTPVPIFYATPTQLGIQIPFELTGTSASAVVSVAGQSSASTPVSLVPVSPGIFTSTADGKGAGAITHVNGSAVTTQSPAQPGELVILYATGLGQVAPAVPTGALPATTSSTVSQVTLTIGGIGVVPDFAGLAGCCVGLNQVNARVPAGVTRGDAVPVVLSIGGKSSNMTSMAVQ